MPRGYATMLGLSLLSLRALAAPSPPPAPVPPEDPAAFLVPDAERALAAHDYGLAVSLWRGVVVLRGDADEAVFRLVDAWSGAGEYDAAVEDLERYAGAVQDEGKRAAALHQISELESRPHGFTGAVFQVRPAEAAAREAFKRGRAAVKEKRFEDALRLYRAGIEMAPDVPGNYRELADVFEQLGRATEGAQWVTRYLRLRPFGENADAARHRLEKTGLLGKLAIDTSFPCDEVWLNRQRMPGHLPSVLAVAAGRYRVLCFSSRYHFARYIDVVVAKGAHEKASFSWAIVENKLEPWGRIVLENPDRPSEMDDVGVWDEIGVPVPDDRRALKVVLRAGDNSKFKEALIRLEPGKRIPLVW